MTSRYKRCRWGLADEAGNIVISGESAKHLGELIGMTAHSIINGANNKTTVGKAGPYFGLRYVKLPSEGMVPSVPILSAEYLRQYGTGEVISWLPNEIPCEHCGRRKPCTGMSKCDAIKAFTGNMLRAMRVLCGVPEPGGADL